MRSAALLVLGACGTSPPGPVTTVYAMDGDIADPAATVIAHRPNGEVIAKVATDATGRADVSVEDGALVSVMFGTQGITTVVTTIEGPAGGGMVVHGPPPTAGAPVVVGAIQIAPAMPLTVDAGFDIALGCITVHTATLPITIDVIAPCLGHDSNVDVLVRGYNSTGRDLPLALVGYAAGRVSLIDGAATFAPAQWETTGPSVPVTIDPGLVVSLAWTLLSDGLAFDVAPVTASSFLWTGLVIDAARIDASIVGQPGTARVTTLAFAGPPTQLAFGPSDFLPALTPSLALDDRAHMRMHWTPADLGDATDLHLGWQTRTTRLNWDVVLPPDASTITLPIDSGTAPVDGQPLDALLRYVDSPDLAGFAPLLADGLYVDQTIRASSIAVQPTSGELRITHEIETF